MAARRVLTPVTITERYPSFRSGRLENWAAESKDGLWKYRRLEISGTPWQPEYVPTGEQGDWYSSLPKARAATADGSALAYIEARRQEDAERAQATRLEQDLGGEVRAEDAEDVLALIERSA